MDRHWQLHVLGCRGSIPVSGKEYMEFGGATSCYVLRRGSYAIVIDCGTGLYRAGPLLRDCTQIDVLLTHIHYDHILGLLEPAAFPPEAEVRFFSQFEQWFGRQTFTRFMSSPFWPYDSMQRFSENLHHVDSPGRVALRQEAEVLFHPSVHPDSASVLRIRTDEGDVAVFFDYEYKGAFPEHMARGARFLLYDAMYTLDEYLTHRGWGHSCWEIGCEIAKSLGVGQLIITHHAPEKTDDDLRALEAEAKSRFQTCHFARCGDVYSLAEGAEMA